MRLLHNPPQYLKRLSATLALAAAFFLGAATARGERPSEWLPNEGKDEEWLKATAQCRRRLQDLDANAALVKQHLSRVQERCRLLSRTTRFTWRTRPAVDNLEALLDDLASGVMPWKRYAGQGFAFAYWSPALERVESIWVQAPPSYDPTRRYQLFMYYKCGGGIRRGEDGRATGGYRPTADMCRRFDDTFHIWSSLDIQVKGRRGAEIELAEVTAELTRDLAIDPDRVFLSGFSDGGYTSLWLGSRYPHLVAGIAPAVANWQYGNVEHVGLLNLPVLVVDGWSDGGYVERNFERFHVLSAMGGDVAALFGQYGHSYAPYENEQAFSKILEWARGKRRNLYPKRVRYATWDLQWARCYWFTIERSADPALAARIDAEVKAGNRIEVLAHNVAAYRLALSDRLVDPAQPVTVVTNGRESYRGPFRADLAVQVTPAAEGKVAKTAAMPGDITGVLLGSTYGANSGDVPLAARRWLAVRPTAGADEARQALASLIPADARADTALTDDDIANHNLVLFGGPELNRLVARIARDLPVKFDKGQFKIGDRVYDKPTHGAQFLCPNPLNPRKYVLVYAFNDPAVARQHDYFHAVGPEEFRSGDCRVFGMPATAPRFGPAHFGLRPNVLERHVFDAHWQVAADAPVGRAATPFHFTALQRLRADAAREAVGADAALVYRYPPRWNRWQTSLPAGPVRLHGIAVCNMFPEYITLADMRGEDLKEAVRTASASSVLLDRRDPAYDAKTSLLLADIDPQRMYKVALDYSGLSTRALTFRSEPTKLPPLLTFASAEEFLGAHAGNRLFLRNPRLTDVEYTEAIARYFRKQQAVTPRRACFDLVQYLDDPEGNDFGTCDWLHLNLSTRGLLHIGLQRPGDPEMAPPRADSRLFAAVDAAAGAAFATDLDRLDKKLPVRVTSTARQFAITAAEQRYQLAPPETKEGMIGRLTVYRLDLSNRGDQTVAGMVVLGPTAVQGANATWPPPGDKSVPAASYHGFRTLAGSAAVPSRATAVLVLHRDAAPAVEKLILPSYGFQDGLIGLKEKLAIPGGQTTTVTLVFVDLAKPQDMPLPEMGRVLEELKKAIGKALPR